MGTLRITAGTFKGRSIHLPDNGRARYTSAKVRQALFNLIGDVTGLSVLDLYAGAGSFTIEAMSRGAGSSVCVEKDRFMADSLRNNLKRLGLDKDCLVMNMEVRYAVPSLWRRHRIYDLVFMDPPYDMGFVRETVELLGRYPLCRGLLVMEHSRRETVPADLFHAGDQPDSRTYGDTVVTMVDCTGRNNERKG